jgi:hypothetical protein
MVSILSKTTLFLGENKGLQPFEIDWHPIRTLPKKTIKIIIKHKKYALKICFLFQIK